MELEIFDKCNSEKKKLEKLDYEKFYVNIRDIYFKLILNYLYYIFFSKNTIKKHNNLKKFDFFV